MKKIYISGAITGTTGYIENFKRAEEYLTNLGYSVINPARINIEMPKDTTYEEYMTMSICMLSMCESIYMLKGWKASPGANRELGYAIGKNMNIIYE